MTEKRLRRRRRLALESLERRDVPATWGIPWADPQHLTISFAPDGTNVFGQPSTLFQTLNTQLGTGTWETTVLRAVQTWASKADINVGLVSDGGEPIGAAGAPEGDPRFGDIRISAAPLSSGVVAIGDPYDPSTGTLSGDVIINSNADFNPNDSGSYDLYTVLLHEFGHSFGFADSTSPSSFMYNVYQGPVSGLAPGAVPALQALYRRPGARPIGDRPRQSEEQQRRATPDEHPQSAGGRRPIRHALVEPGHRRLQVPAAGGRLLHGRDQRPGADGRDQPARPDGDGDQRLGPGARRGLGLRPARRRRLAPRQRDHPAGPVLRGRHRLARCLRRRRVLADRRADEPGHARQRPRRRTSTTRPAYSTRR